MVDNSFRLTIDPTAFEAWAREQVVEFFTDKLGPRIADNAKRTVPVETGDLKKSITVHVVTEGEKPALQVGYDSEAPGLKDPPMDYGPYVEFGTSKMAAQSHLRNAVYQARGRIT